MTSKHVIYGLLDPLTKELRYIGYTSDLKTRFQNHHNPTQLKKKSYKNNWIKSLLSKGLKAEIFIIEEYDTAKELYQAEIELIEYYKAIGCDLTNGTIGGDGNRAGNKRSEETRKKNSESNKGKIRSKETKKKISEAVKLRNLISINNPFYGKHHSDQSKFKMRLAHQGKTWKLVDGKRVWMEK